MSLFKRGEFVSHSGLLLPDKIDCDFLDSEDWDAVARWFSRKIGWSKAIGVPTGGDFLAYAMNQHANHINGPVVICDDVLTTGNSILEVMGQYPGCFGVVLFARGPLPRNVIARFIEQ
jgi:hypothetical protein